MGRLETSVCNITDCRAFRNPKSTELLINLRLQKTRASSSISEWIVMFRESDALLINLSRPKTRTTAWLLCLCEKDALIADARNLRIPHLVRKTLVYDVCKIKNNIVK